MCAPFHVWEDNLSPAFARPDAPVKYKALLDGSHVEPFGVAQGKIRRDIPQFRVLDISSEPAEFTELEASMRAAVCYEFNKPLVVEEVELDPPKAGEVKVRIAVAGICHSDIHHIQGEWGGDLPVIVGHEASGIVEEIGEGVTLVKPGDRVVVSLLRSCGYCFYCAAGSSYQCEGAYALDSETRFRNSRGEPIHHGIDTAAFADFTIVDQSQLAVVPDDVSLEAAALLACGVITGAGAVTNTARVEPGSSVAVIGTGGVGLNSVQGAAIAGANPIIAIDLLDGKLEVAREFGATHVVNALQPDAIEAARRVTGHGVDYAFVTVGDARAAEMGLKLIRREGTLVLVGLPSIDAAMSVSVYDAVVRSRRILGSSMGSTRLSVDIPRLIGLYRQGRLKLDELVTARYPLEQINEAIASTNRGEALRNLIIMDERLM
jgi:S-(hydroxymethyl)glutathione dehydrogenase / alcohol dehydrogenase